MNGEESERIKNQSICGWCSSRPSYSKFI